MCCDVQFRPERLPACLYVNLTVIKSLSTRITAALFIYRLCSMIQTDAQGQSQSDEALTRTLTLAVATSNDTGFEWQGVQVFLKLCLDVCLAVHLCPLTRRCHHMFTMRGRVLRHSAATYCSTQGASPAVFKHHASLLTSYRYSNYRLLLSVAVKHATSVLSLCVAFLCLKRQPLNR